MLPARTRIGVAIAVPEPWGGDLERWRASFGEPQASAIPPHITLIPPVVVEGADLPLVCDHLRAAATGIEPFDVHLRGTGTFRPVSPVVFVALANGIAGCERLQSRVHSGPLDGELHFPFHPHVTVAHDLPDDVLDQAYEALAGFSARFVVESFTLYVHGSDGSWSVDSVVPLGA